MIEPNIEWAQWEARTGFRIRLRESVEKHRADNTSSPHAYLEHKRLEFASELKNKKLIYLDTKHWVNLCHVVLQTPKQEPIALESTRKVQANDMLDYLHAAQGLPYCDALFCDNFMAQKMCNKPLEFGKLYHTEIGSRPEEIVRYLSRLT